MAEFPDHVKQMHIMRGKDSFATEFKVCPLVSTSVRVAGMEFDQVLQLYTHSAQHYCSSVLPSCLQSIPVHTSESTAVGEKNALKNRYKNIVPCEH